MYSEDILLRSLQPKLMLPMTRNMPKSSASVPSRNQPRNMTGIYLGLEGNINPPPNKGGTAANVRKGTSSKSRTTAEIRRYKMVESLRVKENCIKGFKGGTLKKKLPVEVWDEENLTPRCSNPQQVHHRKWGPAKSADPRHFDDVIRQNARHYTAINNNGVTRSENLTGLMSFADHYGFEMVTPPPEALVDEVQRMASAHDDLAGLEECFKKVCKSNPESLHSLLPLRKVSARPGSYSTGFTVRSYRNPNTAEILAEFEPSRPKTVPVNQAHQRQPLVPAPYFFKHFNKPRTANSTKKRNSPVSQPEGDQFSVLNGEKIFGAPGTGTVSRSLRAGGARSSSAWTDGDAGRIRRGTPRNDSPGKDLGVNSSGPLELRAEGVQLGGGGSEERANQGELTGHATHTAPSSESGTGRSGRLTHNTPIMDPPQRQTSNNGTIRLDLENEDGKKQEIYLDDAGRC
ncbi:uncharacterized protein LOC128208139 isoform X2 [Mya arenaria]|uniref:uncharacterized protein LOC128208139 isoform X2 n=1 Tax=Mya arenaria TaxID=6604 RepID=UPI0022E11ADF|nr:uncharacterized protein LOC128208139 isoform X2 [Mya arenaria]